VTVCGRHTLALRMPVARLTGDGTERGCADRLSFGRDPRRGPVVVAPE